MLALRAGALTALETASRTADRISPLFGRPSPRATFYYQGTPATRYWRVTLPAKYLPGREYPAHLVWVRHYVDKQKLTFPQLRGDTAVVQYPGDNGTALLAMAMEAAGKRLLIEVDDCYVDYSDPMWMKRADWGQKIGDRKTTTRGHAWIVEHSAGVIVTTRALAERYRELNDNVYVCRNSIDPDDWPEPADWGETFRIGWYASDSHDRDGVQIAKALSWASRQPNVEVINIGHDPGWSFRRTQYRWTDKFLDQRARLATLDVGVAPLVITPMAKYRSDLKALEYAMAGALPILQGSEPYWEWADQTHVPVCQTPDDWMRAIKWAVQNRDEVRQRAERARDYVLRERTFRTEIDKWRAAVSG